MWFTFQLHCVKKTVNILTFIEQQIQQSLCEACCNNRQLEMEIEKLENAVGSPEINENDYDDHKHL